MNKASALGVLLIAAILEAAGDAIVRKGLGSADAPALRALAYVAGAALLFGYAILVNTTPWDFGRLIGIYIVFFFLTTQAISFLLFHQRPSRATMLGGLLLLAGGAVMTLAES